MATAASSPTRSSNFHNLGSSQTTRYGTRSIETTIERLRECNDDNSFKSKCEEIINDKFTDTNSPENANTHKLILLLAIQELIQNNDQYSQSQKYLDNEIMNNIDISIMRNWGDNKTININDCEYNVKKIKSKCEESRDNLITGSWGFRKIDDEYKSSERPDAITQNRADKNATSNLVDQLLLDTMNLNRNQQIFEAINNLSQLTLDETIEVFDKIFDKIYEKFQKKGSIQRGDALVILALRDIIGKTKLDKHVTEISYKDQNHFHEMVDSFKFKSYKREWKDHTVTSVTSHGGMFKRGNTYDLEELRNQVKTTKLAIEAKNQPKVTSEKNMKDVTSSARLGYKQRTTTTQSHRIETENKHDYEDSTHEIQNYINN